MYEYVPEVSDDAVEYLLEVALHQHPGLVRPNPEPGPEPKILHNKGFISDFGVRTRKGSCAAGLGKEYNWQT